ncbi:MAG: AIPR family protein [Oscillospiraceae bacterium]|nr:AIPR family protein [Oscillospiraceae bacterium]MCL2279844.1 AIPR family protein [Oscillospiraceae bacterium]
MANINDFKVLKNKCVKMFDFLDHESIDDENEKARLGFYHIVLECIAGIDDIDEAKNAIIDSSYNKTIFGHGTDDLGIDAVCFGNDYIDGDKPIYLFNFKYRNEFKEASTRDNDISRSMKFIEYLDLSLSSDKIPSSIGSKVRNIILDIRNKLESNDTYKITLYMVTNQLGDFAPSSTPHINILMENYGINIINLSLGDLTKYIFEPLRTVESKIMLSSGDFLSFDDDSKSTKKSFVAKISLVDVVRMLTSDKKLALNYKLEDDNSILGAEIDTSLLYDNVRGYLGETRFNNNIKNTLNHSFRNFFMFNNGITVTAEEITSEGKNSNEKYLFTLKNYQIVNGGQTIRTIFSYLHDFNVNGSDSTFNFRNTYILTRFFKIEKDSKLKNEIAEYTNSQNQISAFDLKSVDNIQIQIENYLKEHKILYVRKVGSTGDDFTTYDNRITKKELAQVIYSIQGFPERVTNSPIKLFTDYYNQIFPSDNFPFEETHRHIGEYFSVKSQYKSSSTVMIFYILFLFYEFEMSFEDAFEFITDFVEKEKPEDISIPRYLIQKGTKEKMIKNLGIKRTKVSTDTKRRRSNNSFALLNIPIGAELSFLYDASIVAKVKDRKNSIEFEGKVYSVTALALKILKEKHGRTDSSRENGWRYFTFGGKTLSDLRNVIENADKDA